MRHPLKSRECMYGNAYMQEHTYIFAQVCIYIHITQWRFYRTITVSSAESWNNHEHGRTSTKAEI